MPTHGPLVARLLTPSVDVSTPTQGESHEPTYTTRTEASASEYDIETIARAVLGDRGQGYACQV